MIAPRSAHFITAPGIIVCVLFLFASCTADDAASESGVRSERTPPTAQVASLEQVLCQVSVTGPDGEPDRDDLILNIGGGNLPPFVATHIDVYRFELRFTDDGFGAPSLSFLVFRENERRRPLLNEHMQLSRLDDGGVGVLDNQIGSSFTGTAYLRDGPDVTLTRSCRTL